MLGFLLSLPFWYVFIEIAEYWAHRFIMHLPFHTHRTNHHEQYKNHPVFFHIDLPVYYHLLVASPIFFMLYRMWAGISWIFSNYLAGSWSVVGAACSLFMCLCIHSYVWSKLHRAFHKIEHNWTKYLNFYDELLDHHMLHHRYPWSNFGVMCRWTDRLFGTRCDMWDDIDDGEFHS